LRFPENPKPQNPKTPELQNSQAAFFSGLLKRVLKFCGFEVLRFSKPETPKLQNFRTPRPRFSAACQGTTTRK
jgi:hypothetical protein